MPSSSLLRNKVSPLFLAVPAIQTLIFKQRFFPPFSNLPDYDDVSDVYHTDPYVNGTLTNRIHWCFVGEIMANASLVRPVFHVRDRDGKKAIVALYLDTNETRYNPKKFVVGNTICVMYAYKKTFLDGSEGIRVEEVECIQGRLQFLLLLEFAYFPALP